MAKTVAILGGGPSGLAVCKAALEEGLQPTVFEQSPGLGGLWRSDSFGKVWTNLRTNLSKYTCAFSDFPWPEEAPDFPEASEVQDYLEKFATAHWLRPHLRLGCTVTSLEPTEVRGEPAWTVRWKDTTPGRAPADAPGDDASETFDFAVVATGIFTEPCVPRIDTLGHFSGEVLHAAAYREPAQVAGRRVLVVGAAFSGADIAADIAGTAASVVISAATPLWYLPRRIGGKPLDLVFYSRAGAEKSRARSEEERNKVRHTWFKSVVGELPEGVLEPDPDRDLPFAAISDAFLSAVRGGGVRVRASRVVGFEGQAARFADGHREEVDVVILATGYRLSLPFVSQTLLKQIEFDGEDLLQPAVLHECVWRPELPRLAFVGLYRGPYFAAIELQARWACGVFSGRLPAPTDEDAAKGLEVERRIREQRPRPQFPHSNYVDMVEDLARQVGVHPGDLLEDQVHPLHRLLYEGPLLPFHFRLTGFMAKPELAEAAICACVSKFPLA